MRMDEVTEAAQLEAPRGWTISAQSDATRVRLVMFDEGMEDVRAYAMTREQARVLLQSLTRAIGDER